MIIDLYYQGGDIALNSLRMLATSEVDVDPFSTHKPDVIKRALSVNHAVIYKIGFGAYHHTVGYYSLLEILKHPDNARPKIHEYINSTQPVNLFFDVDMKIYIHRMEKHPKSMEN